MDRSRVNAASIGADRLHVWWWRGIRCRVKKWIGCPRSELPIQKWPIDIRMHLSLFCFRPSDDPLDWCSPSHGPKHTGDMFERGRRELPVGSSRDLSQDQAMQQQGGWTGLGGWRRLWPQRLPERPLLWPVQMLPSFLVDSFQACFRRMSLSSPSSCASSSSSSSSSPAVRVWRTEAVRRIHDHKTR